ncbi:transposase [Nonomuraea jabiensis]|uniref:transposase n=1 Tax=Nonomuraea jabiensis TaxID=882448 RepID=UPI003D72CF0B
MERPDISLKARHHPPSRPRHGLRRARYRGIKKVHLEHIVCAIAVNLIRLDAW